MKGLIVLLISVFVFAFMSLAEEVPKSETVKRTIDAVQKIYEVASVTGNALDENGVREVARVVASLKSIDQLSCFAILTRNIASPQRAGDEYIDSYFDRAFWEAVEVIAKNKTKEGRRGLQIIERRILLDGGDRLTFDILVKKQLSP